MVVWTVHCTTQEVPFTLSSMLTVTPGIVQWTTYIVATLRPWGLHKPTAEGHMETPATQLGSYKKLCLGVSVED